jgi:Carboxypeptidase regulatory-like domain
MKVTWLRMFALAAIFSPSLLLAQDTASLTGTVSDPSGASVANAQVTLTSTQEGVSRSAASNSSGEYLFAALPIAKYNMTVTAAGFKKYEIKNIQLAVGQRARNDVRLEVGAIQETVNVEGSNVAQVETQSSDLTGVVGGKEVTELQLNGRDFKQLVTLVPGVSNQTGSDEGGVGVTANNSFSINGGRVEYNNWEIDGGDNMDNGSNNTLNVTPSLDAIGEFKVLTSNYGAQYGRSGSGTIEVETKSGTSKFHGDVYEFLRNDAFNATPYFLDGPPAYKKNDFGYTFGGPIYIPGHYNSNKQKTFFFWSQEWRRDRLPYTFSPQGVPSAAQRAGDFSDICPGSDCPVDPATGNPYPGNIVPVNASDPNIQGLLSMIPLPNTVIPPTPLQPVAQNLYTATISQPTNWREELLRIDHNFSDKHRLTFRYTHDAWTTLNPNPLWTNQGSFPTVQTDFAGPGLALVARLSSTLSPTLLNEFVFSYTTDHIVLSDVGNFKRLPGSTFGGIFPGADRGILPGINLNDVGSAYGGGSFGEDPGYIPNGPYNSNPTYTYRDNVSKIAGKHSMQFGAYFVAGQKNELGGELGAGSYPGYLTFDPSSSTTTTGNPFADLLLGYIASFGQQNATIKYYNRYKIVEPYFQDDWHVTSRLTLNLGLRLSLFGTYRERYHQAFNFDPAAYQAGLTTMNTDGTVNNLTPDGGAPSVTDLPNGIVQCGVGGEPAGCVRGHLFNPAPRIGFAWDPRGDGKTAIRGGYGIFFEHGNGNEANSESLENSPPLAFAAQQNNIVGYQNIGAGNTASTQLPLSVNSIQTKAVWPYVQQWHLDIQRDIARGTVATLSYVGSKGTHLNRVSNLNQLHPIPSSQNPYKVGEPIGGSDCGTAFDANHVPTAAKTPSGVLVTGQAAIQLGISACGTNADLFRPFPGYGDIAYLVNASSSTYHALQFALRRSLGGLDLNFAYTYSHSIDDSSDRFDTSFVDAYNPAANRASSSFDQRHVLNFGYVWDLPFFKTPGLTHTVLGGWRYSGITTFSTGSPFSVLFSTDNAGVGNGLGSAAYMDIVGNPKSGVRQADTFVPDFGPLLYNPAAYTVPRGLTFGDSGRNSLRNPNRINFDMALMKDFAVTERTALEFRAEAFNIFNHTEWGAIAGDAGSGAGNNSTGSNVLSGDPVADVGAGAFKPGLVHSPRILQLALKFIF